jgi:hypothetical protein
MLCPLTLAQLRVRQFMERPAWFVSIGREMGFGLSQVKSGNCDRRRIKHRWPAKCCKNRLRLFGWNMNFKPHASVHCNVSDIERRATWS